jgi:glucose/arabinose dehydrogenase
MAPVLEEDVMLRGPLVKTTALAAATLLAVALVPAWPVAAQGSDVRLAPILDGYTRPVLVTHAGSGRTIFIVEQTGRIKRATFANGQWQKLGTFLDLSDKVIDPRDGDNERGLLGLAFHPDYATNGLFYVHYTRRGGPRTRGDIIIAEFRRQSEGSADPSSRRVIMRINHSRFANHNGGNLAFGPDGMLYIGLGDGGSADDPFGNGQDKTTRLGKILRIDPRRSGRRAFQVPSSNPFVGRRGLDVIWAYGLRNPWRFTFDRLTGDLWIGDVGQNSREEVDKSSANDAGRMAGRGRNYGWSRCEGMRSFPSGGSRCRVGTLPVHDYAHGPDRHSVTGGYVHRGPDAPGWRGLYIAGDFFGRLFVLNKRGGVRLSKDTNRSLSSFGEDAAGRLFATDLGSGEVFQIEFVGGRP